MQLLMPVFPGQMRSIRKNLFHAIYIVDPASPDGLLASGPISFSTVLMMSEFLWNWVHNLKLVLQWLCHMQGLRHVQQLGNVHLSESMKLSRLTCSICDEKGGLFVHFFQALENMFYLHSSNVPIRFGVILLSTKALEQNEAFKENSLIEDGSEEREAGIDVNDRQDLSTLVKLPEFPPSSFHCCDHCFLNFWCQMSTWLLSCFRV